MLPDSIRDVEHLEELLSEPSPAAIEALAGLDGDVVLLGVGGKMGPTLARMARRAADAAGRSRRILAASRFSEPGLEERLNGHGIETIRCDLLDPAAIARLPDAPLIIFMTGRKFGSTGQEALTWAMNCHLPALVCQRYAGSRIVAFSTGNVYGLTPATRGGSCETDTLAPVGEYAITCVGRERHFEYFSQTHGTPVALLRLNYATEMRYGVLVDVARQVHAGEPVSLGMGCLNAIWQADANAVALACLARTATPPLVLNLTGPETLSVRWAAMEFGRLFGREPRFQGEEAPDALLSNAARCVQYFGYPRVGVLQMVHWIADWVRRDMPSLDKPTHYEAHDGRF